MRVVSYASNACTNERPCLVKCIWRFCDEAATEKIYWKGRFCFACWIFVSSLPTVRHVPLSFIQLGKYASFVLLADGKCLIAPSLHGATSPRIIIHLLESSKKFCCYSIYAVFSRLSSI